VCLAERVRAVPGFGAKTEQRLFDACERWLGRGDAAPRRLLMTRALELSELLRRELLQVLDEVHLAGALRRGEETVGELEFVVVGDVRRAYGNWRDCGRWCEWISTEALRS
jgi:DNA polymerase (family 10)